MTIYLGADHRGFALKEKLKAMMAAEAYDVADLGASALVPEDDYADCASAVAEKVSSAPLDAKGIVICGSGVGVDVVANKFSGVRSALGLSPDQVYEARHDDDANILSLAADFTDEAAAMNMVKVFLTTPFAKEERYARRLQKIGEIEKRKSLS